MGFFLYYTIQCNNQNYFQNNLSNCNRIKLKLTLQNKKKVKHVKLSQSLRLR